MQVNITKRIDTPEGKRYCPVVICPNGRIKPDGVMMNDRQEPLNVNRIEIGSFPNLRILRNLAHDSHTESK